MKRTLLFVLSLLLLVVGGVTAADGNSAVLHSSLSEIPTYNGFDYVEIQEGQPDFYVWQIQEKAYVTFSDLDALGRTGAGMACLGPETLPTTTRNEIGSVQPSGWQTTRYDDLIESRYLYNRAHVIGHLLCGDNGTPENLFTGTAYMNAGAMLLFETRVLQYIEQTGNHVLYRCTPMYEGDHLIASGVQMEAYSVEDSGELHFNVFVFNVQPGVEIDYATGESRIASEQTVRDTEGRSAATAETPKATYILNTNTKKFHYPDCSSAADIKEKNRKEFYGTREEAIEAGYSPCGRCHP